MQALILALELHEPDTFCERGLGLGLGLGAAGGLAVLTQPVPESRSADAVSSCDVLAGFRRGHDLAAQLVFDFLGESSMRLGQVVPIFG